MRSLPRRADGAKGPSRPVHARFESFRDSFTGCSVDARREGREFRGLRCDGEPGSLVGMRQGKGVR
jgi:hypothetical protein